MEDWRREDGDDEAPRVVLSEYQSDGESDASDDGEERRRYGRVRVFLANHWGPLALFVAGLILLVVVVVLIALENGYTYQDETRILLMVGCFLCGWLVADLSMLLLLAVVEMRLRKTDQMERRYRLTVVAYYVSGAQQSLAVTLWMFYSLMVVVGFQIASFDSIEYDWETINYYLVRVLVIFLLVALSVAIAVISRMYIAQDFGTRSYQARVQKTLENEHLLASLRGRFDPVFLALYEQRQLSGNDPDLWQRMMRYVIQHNVDSTPAKHVYRRFEVKSSEQSRVLANRIFRRIYAIVVAQRAVGCDTVESNDLTVSSTSAKPEAHRRMTKAEFFNAAKTMWNLEEAYLEHAWTTVLDVKGSGTLSSPRFRKIVDSTFADRRSMALTLQDSQAVIKSIDSTILAVLLVFVAMVGLGLFSEDSVQQLASLTAAILAWSFVFGNSVRENFENLIFLFSVHPYDVGDSVQIGEARFQVVRIRLLSTDFVREDGALYRIRNVEISRFVDMFNFTTAENFGIPIRVHVPLFVAADPAFIETVQRDMDDFCTTKESVVSARLTARNLVHPLQAGSGWEHPTGTSNTGTSNNNNNNNNNPFHALHCQLTLWVTFAFPHTAPGVTFAELSQVVTAFCASLHAYGATFDMSHQPP